MRRVSTAPLAAAAGFAAAAVMLTALAGCRPKNQFVPPPPPTVTVAQPLRRDVVDYFQTTGETRAVQHVELRAQVSGYLKQINFKDGELVEKDRLLFVVDPHRYQAAVNSAKANVLKAEASLKLAEAQLSRTQALVERKAATKDQLDQAEAERAVAAADLSAARSAVSRAELDLGFTEIRAPFAGRMGRHQVDIGNLVEVGSTLLSTIETVDPIHAYFNLSESDLLRFRTEAGGLALDRDNPPEIELALGQTGDFVFKGKLDFQEFGVDPSTGTTVRRAVFPNADERLVPGLFVRVRTPTGPPKPRLLVEERAISTDQRGDFLYVVTEKKPDPQESQGQGTPGQPPQAPGKGQAPAQGPAAGGADAAKGDGKPPGPKYVVEYRSVKFGPSDHGLRVVLEGIGPDDWVIINGLQRARPNAEVVPERTQMAGGKPGEPTAFRILPSESSVANRPNGGPANQNK